MNSSSDPLTPVAVYTMKELADMLGRPTKMPDATDLAFCMAAIVNEGKLDDTLRRW